MNNDRRDQILAVRTKLENLQADVTEIIRLVEEIQDDEQDYFDAMPENFALGEKGLAAQDAISALNDAVEILKDVPKRMEAADDELETASE